jgi:CheY-like chemotaxis protein
MQALPQSRSASGLCAGTRAAVGHPTEMLVSKERYSESGIASALLPGDYRFSRLHRRKQSTLRRILLVDDHEVVRAGLARLLQDSWDICGEAANGREAVDMVLELKPDLVVLDLSMPVMGGTAAAREIRSLSPATKIVLLSMHDTESVVELSRLVGADACVSKRSAANELRKAITAVLKEPPRGNGLRVFDPT